MKFPPRHPPYDMYNTVEPLRLGIVWSTFCSTASRRGVGCKILYLFMFACSDEKLPAWRMYFLVLNVASSTSLRRDLFWDARAVFEHNFKSKLLGEELVCLGL